MVQPKHEDIWPRSVRLSLAAALLVALFVAVTVLPAGAQNTAFGTGALASVTTGTDDTAFGFDALNDNTSGSFNTATGFEALEGNITGVANTAVGAGALLSNTTGANNTATGVSALQDNATGGHNTATGTGSLLSNTTGISNTATGNSALASNTTGTGNTATGETALAANTTGGDNTAIGLDALANDTTGDNNIAVGLLAGSSLTIGSNNIDISNQGVPGESNTIRIGTQGTQTATFVAGIFGTSLPTSTARPVVVDSSGHLGVRPGGGMPSSARLKRDIRSLGKASSGLLKLRPVSFRYKDDSHRALQYGLIAEEVERVYPELVTYREDGKVEGVRYELLPALLVNEMQKQAKQIATLTAQTKLKDGQIAAQQRQIASQQEQIDGLKKNDAQIVAVVERIDALERQARLARSQRMAAAMR